VTYVDQSLRGRKMGGTYGGQKLAVMTTVIRDLGTKESSQLNDLHELSSAVLVPNDTYSTLVVTTFGSNHFFV
jgi:hypothetical protein